MDPILLAVRDGHVGDLMNLIRTGAPVQMSEGTSPLHMAALHDTVCTAINLNHATGTMLAYFDRKRSQCGRA